MRQVKDAASVQELRNDGASSRYPSGIHRNACFEQRQASAHPPQLSSPATPTLIALGLTVAMLIELVEVIE